MNSRLTNTILLFVATIVYICIDFLYVFLSKHRYEQVFESIQHQKMEVDVVSALICYTVMALGWYCITVQLAFTYFSKIKQCRPTWRPISISVLSGLASGFVYGFVLYGVYNLTTRAVFASRYPMSIFVRDLAWGTLYNATYTSLFMLLWQKLTKPVDL